MNNIKILLTVAIISSMQPVIFANNIQMESITKKIVNKKSASTGFHKREYAICKSNKDILLIRSYTESGEWGRLYDWHFSSIDNKGKTNISDKYLGSYSVPYTDQQYPSRTLIQLSDKNILAYSQLAFDTGGEMFISIINSKGEIVKRDSAMGYVSSTPQLIKNKQNEVFVLGHYNYYWKLRKIYPTFAMDVKRFRFPKELRDDFVALPLDNKILICARPTEYTIDLKNDELGCFMINYSGDIISPVTKIDIWKDAFNVVKNAYLPGGIYKKGDEIMIEGFDFTETSNGEYVLSVNWWDKNDSACIHQIKFNKDGNLIKPGKLTFITPISLKEKAFPIITKNGITYMIFKSKDGMLNKLNAGVFWGYDEKDNFYWTSIPIE